MLLELGGADPASPAAGRHQRRPGALPGGAGCSSFDLRSHAVTELQRRRERRKCQFESVPRAGAGLWRWSSATGSYETACSAPVISVAVNASESDAGAVQVPHRGDAVWPGLAPGRPARCTTADPGRSMVATSRHGISPGLERPLGAQGAPQVACVKKRYNLCHPGVQHTVCLRFV